MTVEFKIGDFTCAAEQRKEEMIWLLKELKGTKTLLEIGSRTGGMLAAMASVCEPGAKIRSIDLGLNIDPRWFQPPSAEALKATIEHLKGIGFDAECFIGDSKSREAIAFAFAGGPYDFVFIDGDHTFEGARSDWLIYGPMGAAVGFHDIANTSCGVRRLWKNIKFRHSTIERIGQFSDMGIGVVINESYETPIILPSVTDMDNKPLYE